MIFFKKSSYIIVFDRISFRAISFFTAEGKRKREKDFADKLFVLVLPTIAVVMDQAVCML
jgi:hypothetical protein